MNTNPSTYLENQFLATKFYAPVTSGTLIPRPRLTALLNESLKYPFALISAPAGFGKTTLLSAWCQSLATHTPLVVWVSLDVEDNDPQLFWTNILVALAQKQPGIFIPLLRHLQSSQTPPLKSILIGLINLLLERTEQFVLILDDYHLINKQQVHTTLAYLVDHLPAQLRIVVATRADPLLPLSQLRARQQIQEIRGDELRCTVEETTAFFQQVIGLDLPEETVQEVMVRTEGWLVGLHLLRLSLPKPANPLSLLEEVGGNQRYILDYLTEEVLRQQPQEVQTFLLSTCILERLSASLCNAVMEQSGSQQMLQRLEKANVFIVSLDSRRGWYRYHALFAEALRYRLEQTHADLVPVLHYRASLWYAEHDQTTQAILHAFHAKEWQWAADLIERKSLQVIAFTWGSGEHELAQLRQWLERLPIDIMGSRPRLCVVCAQLLWTVTPQSVLEAWLAAAEATLNASLTRQIPEEASSTNPTQQVRQEQENLLGEVIATRAYLWGYQEENGQIVLSLCQQALSLLSVENSMIRAQICFIQLRAYYFSSLNDAVAAIQSGLQAGSRAQAAGRIALAMSFMGSTAALMIGTGQLREAQRLNQQAIQLGTQPGGLALPDTGWPSVWQAEILREWNRLDMALSLAEEAVSLCKQRVSLASLVHVLFGYAIMLRVSLSCGDYDAARSALQQFESLGRKLNRYIYIDVRSRFITVEEIRLWLACGELDRSKHWAEELDIGKRHSTLFPFIHEREEVACVRVLLAQAQPTLALQRLESVLIRATAGKRWRDVMEMRLLQALAHSMLREEVQALDSLSEAVRLGEPEGYIRSFVDEGTPMEVLLYRLRKRDRKSGPTPYLDTLLAAFQRESKAHIAAGESTETYQLPEPLSQRELEVLQLLARGESNQEIGQELVITIDTVKRHVSHIFSKLGVQNRVQAVRQARELGLLGEQS